MKPTALAPAFHTIFQSTPDLIAVLSADLTVVFVNNSYLSASNLTSEAIVGIYIFDAFPENPADQAADGQSPPETRRGPIRILVVDDNPDSAHSMAHALELRGNHVHVAFDGPSALKFVRQAMMEYILLDIRLPGMDGYEVATPLRQEPSAKSAVIIAISGYGQDEDRRRSLQAGFNHHLVKPIDFDTLASLMHH